MDLFGRGFVLLRLGSSPLNVDALVDAAKARNVPLTVVDIASPAVTELYERKLVMVRPDGHCVWRSDEAPTDAVSIIDRVRGALN